ncbi:MAG: M20/M25/M40 family metallo-hydrolase [Bacteroidales bacterium]|nr:M20/M25/M40 family metallo-hydrolase [Bacteroidales bacterium]
MKLLKKLCELHGPSGEEYRIRDFIIEYVQTNSKKWKKSPDIITDNLQGNIILVFGKPKLAVFAHMDSVGFTARYNNQLVRIGSPVITQGTKLRGFCGNDLVVGELLVNEEDDSISIKSEKTIDPGTALAFCPNFQEDEEYVVSPFLDNRLGVYTCLKIAKDLENGILVFTSLEEHGGGSVEIIARILYEKYKITKALIADITWVTDGVFHGQGAVVSLRDKYIPRKDFVDLIRNILKTNDLKHQIEVEESGSSDGGYLQKTPYPIDWCFIGAPEANAHSAEERVHKNDIESMMKIYKILVKKLQDY